MPSSANANPAHLLTMCPTRGNFEDFGILWGAFFIGENMGALFQIGSMITSLIGLIMFITLIFAEEDSNVFRYFGEKEAMICVAVAFVLMIAGYLVDRR